MAEWFIILGIWAGLSGVAYFLTLVYEECYYHSTGKLKKLVDPDYSEAKWSFVGLAPIFIPVLAVAIPLYGILLGIYFGTSFVYNKYADSSLRPKIREFRFRPARALASRVASQLVKRGKNDV